MIKEYGYAIIGQRLKADRSGNRNGKRVSAISVRDYKHNLLNPFYFEGSTNKGNRPANPPYLLSPS